MLDERIIELVLILLSELRRTNKPLAELDLRGLEAQGFSKAEISTACTWLTERTRSAEWGHQSAQAEASFRVLHQLERQVITPEAHGYLMQLRELRVISQNEMESAIERAMISGMERVEVVDMQAVLVAVLFDDERFDATKARMLFHSTDSVH